MPRATRATERLLSVVRIQASPPIPPSAFVTIFVLMNMIGAMFEKEHPVEGQTPGFKGSVMIYTVKDADEAWELIRGDVYAKNDVWDLEKAQVIPFKSAIRESL
ncbi:hypothetical protein COL5a_002448 [Colletotrichum fioriniae]|nr:hypothetical protein COL5a_002448 [Colletotrichum fioriniae]